MSRVLLLCPEPLGHGQPAGGQQCVQRLGLRGAIVQQYPGDIAQRLVLETSTIKTHVSRILVKLGLRDRTQAAVFAYEARLVTPG